jgi:hypothetical protein
LSLLNNQFFKTSSGVKLVVGTHALDRKSFNKTSYVVYIEAMLVIRTLMFPLAGLFVRMLHNTFGNFVM